MGLKIEREVEKVNGKELSYIDFAHNYLARNQPVILTGLTDDWRACKDWVSDDGKPNLRYFSAHFGSSRVQVADCGTKEFTDQNTRIEMSVSEFMDRGLDISGSNGRGGDEKLLYLKDWHFFKEYPEYIAYSTPTCFCDDWLNLYLDKFRMHNDRGTNVQRHEICCSDYRFVYMGAKGTWTPLHADVFRSYSWSANVCGRKKWYFLSPSQHHLVFDRNKEKYMVKSQHYTYVQQDIQNLKNCNMMIKLQIWSLYGQNNTKVDDVIGTLLKRNPLYMKSSVYDIFENVCKTKFPGFEKTVWWECTQEQNEIIFVPSGWYHQVHNLEDTISINHNWFNAYNISWVWELLLREYHEARWYIEDIKDICDDFEGLCQRNLAANAGMDFKDLFIVLIRFTLANLFLLDQLTSGENNINMNQNWSKISQLVSFNLKSIRCMALKMKDVAAAWENLGITINPWEIVEDTLFVELCICLATAYCMMFDINFNLNQVHTRRFNVRDGDFSVSHICNPEDLVTFLDEASKLVGVEC